MFNSLLALVIMWNSHLDLDGDRECYNDDGVMISNHYACQQLEHYDNLLQNIKVCPSDITPEELDILEDDYNYQIYYSKDC